MEKITDVVIFVAQHQQPGCLKKLQGAAVSRQPNKKVEGPRYIIMRLSSFLVLVSVLLLNFSIWWGFNRPESGQNWSGTINSVSFSPYREGQDPRASLHPSPEQVEADLQLLAGKVSNVRTYTVEDGMDVVPRLARKYNLTVMIGAWISDDLARNDRELAALVDLTKQNSNVKRALIGNEALLRDDVEVSAMVAYLKQAREKLNQAGLAAPVPISTAEPWHIWLKYPELAEASDFIAVHILPYWEGVPMEESVDYVMHRYRELKTAYPDKPIVITEVGWPSDGRMREKSVPSRTGQANFLRDFLNLARDQQLDYTIMEAFDQPWKRGIEGSVGAYWGLYDAERNPKFPMAGPVSETPTWWILCAITTALAVFPAFGFLRKAVHVHWSGRFFFAALMFVAASILTWTGYVALTQYLSGTMVAVWGFLFFGQLLLIAVLLADGFEITEVIWRKGWKREFKPLVGLDDRRHWPMVSLHLPCCNEPPEMVIQTLDSLSRLDYPNFEVIVIDNNTKNPEVWKPLEAHCAQLGPRFRFYHLDVCEGFKAGALNYILEKVDPRTEIVGVVDSDYLVEPYWLRSLIPYFDAPKVGFVQAPQDHRDWHGNTFKEMINWEYAGFFHLGMVQRNERNAIIQHGTMTLIRKSAMDQVGNWSEWCICEDAEMGLRLFEGGYEAVYLNHCFGKGVTPDSFTGYKKQRFRWAYGAMQILKGHWRQLFWFNSPLTIGQRYHFIAGWLPWVADGISLIFTLAGLVWTAGVLAFPKYFDFPLALFLVPTLGLFLFKVMQTLVSYRVRIPCNAWQRVGAAIAGLSLTHAVGKAVLYGLFTKKMPFLRTPKMENAPAFLQAFVMAREDLLIMTLLWSSAIFISIEYGKQDRETLIWAMVLIVQSFPYVAGVITATISAMPHVRIGKLGALPAPVPENVVPDNTASGAE